MPEPRACRDGCGQLLDFKRNADDTGWERPTNNVDGPGGAAGQPHECPKRQRSAGGARAFGKSPGEQHDIRREAVLNSAVAFAAAKCAQGIDLSSKDVVAVARAFLSFVEEGRPT